MTRSWNRSSPKGLRREPAGREALLEARRRIVYGPISRLQVAKESRHVPDNRGRPMDSSDKAYFLERAEAELDLANAAKHGDTAKAHYYLAAFYLDRAHEGVANDD
jgi:hypothetical protein